MKTFMYVTVLLVNLSGIWSFEADKDVAPSKETIDRIYKIGIDMGIVNPNNYTFETFERDEGTVFRDLYRQYLFLCNQPVSYEEWIIMNNFGLLYDTQESVIRRRIQKRNADSDKSQFVNTAKMGDIIITGQGIGGLVGHAAIMITDNLVLEMPGGYGWMDGIPSNNRRIGKDAWFDERFSDWKYIFRCPNNTLSRNAALWAEQNFYNPTGGDVKTIHVTYKITADVWSLDPNYCSKLVIQAYHFSNEEKTVIDHERASQRRVIVPTMTPAYFLSPYKLEIIGRY